MVQRGENSSLDGSKPTYMKNVPKPTTWDNKNKRNIKTFFTEYETYCDASGYIGNEVEVRNFESVLKEGASIAFAAWRDSRGKTLPWKD